MGLTAFQPKTEEVEFPGGTFTVRGLSFDDIAWLIGRHHDPIKALFDKYVTESAAKAVDLQFAGGKLGLSDIRSVVLEAMQEAPGLVGDVIARAADEKDNPEIARLLPMGVQIDAVERVLRLTLEAEGGLEKLAETVSRVAAGVAALVPDRPT